MYEQCWKQQLQASCSPACQGLQASCSHAEPPTSVTKIIATGLENCREVPNCCLGGRVVEKEILAVLTAC